ncbi:MAG: ARMT1-like domain-containing protein [Candidatus Margulisbacteria bacterium]|nr:ARMT1-like domain-containing protein [Candidatus Margulisiibacteriota bacterium]
MPGPELLNKIGSTAKAYPFAMETVLNSRWQFNLNYQFSRIVQWSQSCIKYENILSIVSQQYLAEQAMFLFSAVLKTIMPDNKPLFYSLNNQELDLIGTKILKLSNKSADIHSDIINSTALTALRNIFPSGSQRKNLQETLAASIYAGTVWWHQPEFYNEPGLATKTLLNKLKASPAIDHLNDLLNLINKNPALKILYIVDDNGETVFDLNFIKNLMEHYQKLKVKVWANTNSIKPNTSVADIKRILKDEYFTNLRTSTNFSVIGQPSELETIDLRFASKQLINLISDSDLLIIKGANFFENLAPNLQTKHRFHLFTVYQSTLQNLTGLSRESGVMAHLGPGQQGYGPIDQQGDPAYRLKDIIY